jgi:hypothetical protein
MASDNTGNKPSYNIFVGSIKEVLKLVVMT